MRSVLWAAGVGLAVGWLTAVGCAGYALLAPASSVGRRIGGLLKVAPRATFTALHAKALGSKGSGETFFCQSCGAEHAQWAGRCNFCKEWNTIKTFKVSKSSSTARTSMSSRRSAPTAVVSQWIDAQIVSNSSLASLSSITTRGQVRLPVFSSELSRVLGGGLVQGSVVLVAGEPGIGKSTLLLQLAAGVALEHGDVVYVSGEENEQQITLRAQRLGLNQHAQRLFLLCEVNLDIVLETIASLSATPALVILDSIQTMRLDDSAGGLGSVGQIRDCTARVLQFAKSSSVPFVLVGHVTKSGDVAGPRVLEHMVDAVVQIEGSDKADYRLLRAEKNRFGSASEVGVVEMTDQGLRDVANPSAVFLSSSLLHQPQEGAAVLVTVEGSRPILAEVQCLVSPSPAAAGPRPARRASDGFPIQRLFLLSAVIEKRLRLPLSHRDIFVNVAGGLRVTDPTADLAVTAALVSSLLGLPVRPATVFLGEVGLGGELRGGRRIEQRVLEAAKLGFTRILVPASSGVRADNTQAQIVPCENVAQAMEQGLTGYHTEVNSQRRGRHQPVREEQDWTEDMDGAD